MNYLCLDYGAKHVGLAFAVSPLAEPLATYDIKVIFNKLPEIITKYSIREIVIGNCPDDFMIKLKAFHLPIIQVDETLTTVDATQALFHTTKSRRKAQIHSVSAAIILQSHLDSGSYKS